MIFNLQDYTNLIGYDPVTGTTLSKVTLPTVYGTNTDYTLRLVENEGAESKVGIYYRYTSSSSSGTSTLQDRKWRFGLFDNTVPNPFANVLAQGTFDNAMPAPATGMTSSFQSTQYIPSYATFTVPPNTTNGSGYYYFIADGIEPNNYNGNYHYRMFLIQRVTPALPPDYWEVDGDNIDIAIYLSGSEVYRESVSENDLTTISSVTDGTTNYLKGAYISGAVLSSPSGIVGGSAYYDLTSQSALPSNYWEQEGDSLDIVIYWGGVQVYRNYADASGLTTTTSVDSGGYTYTIGSFIGGVTNPIAGGSAYFNVTRQVIAPTYPTLTCNEWDESIGMTSWPTSFTPESFFSSLAVETGTPYVSTDPIFGTGAAREIGGFSPLAIAFSDVPLDKTYDLLKKAFALSNTMTGYKYYLMLGNDLTYGFRLVGTDNITYAKAEADDHANSYTNAKTVVFGFCGATSNKILVGPSSSPTVTTPVTTGGGSSGSITTTPSSAPAATNYHSRLIVINI